MGFDHLARLPQEEVGMLYLAALPGCFRWGAGSRWWFARLDGIKDGRKRAWREQSWMKREGNYQAAG